MDTQNKPTAHPIMVIAAVAVVLFCGVGSAAILGWLPTSNATVPEKVSAMPPAPEQAPRIRRSIRQSRDGPIPSARRC